MNLNYWEASFHKLLARNNKYGVHLIKGSHTNKKWILNAAENCLCLLGWDEFNETYFNSSKTIPGLASTEAVVSACCIPISQIEQPELTRSESVYLLTVAVVSDSEESQQESPKKPDGQSAFHGKDGVSESCRLLLLYLHLDTPEELEEGVPDGESGDWDGGKWFVVEAAPSVSLECVPYGLYTSNGKLVLCGSDGGVHTFTVHRTPLGVTLQEQPQTAEHLFQDLAVNTGQILSFAQTLYDHDAEAGTLFATGDIHGVITLRLDLMSDRIVETSRVSNTSTNSIEESGATISGQSCAWIVKGRIDGPVSDMVFVRDSTGSHTCLVIAGVVGSVTFFMIDGKDLIFQERFNEPLNASVLCLGSMDFDLDGEQEVLVGTFDGTIDIFKVSFSDEKGKHEAKSVNIEKLSSITVPFPVYGLRSCDLNHDEIEELIVLTMSSCHVFQINYFCLSEKINTFLHRIQQFQQVEQINPCKENVP